MNLEFDVSRTPATIEEIHTRVAYALERHPLCRNVKFDIVRSPLARNGANWTISLRSITPDALWETSEIVQDIQEAYVLAAAA